MASLFRFILAHQGDSADPVLLHWIKERMDAIFGSGPWVMVALMGLIIVAIPVCIGVLYLMQSNQNATAKVRLNTNEPEGENIK